MTANRCGALAASLAAAMTMAPLESSVAQGASLAGRITDAASREPIVAAVVRLFGPREWRISWVDTAGKYAFSGLRAATYDLRVDAPGFVASTVRVVLDDSIPVTVDIALDLSGSGPVTLARVVVTADSTGSGRSTMIDMNGERMPWHAMMGGTHRAAGAVSGALAPTERGPPGFNSSRPTHVLFMAGPDDARGRVIIDDAPLDAPLQVARLLPPMDPNVLAGYALRRGGASPRFDGGAAYIVDIRTRAPRRDARQLWGDVDPLAVRVGAESPVGKSSALSVSARRVNGELVQELIQRPFGYFATDAVARASWFVRQGHLGITALTTSEGVMIPRDQGFLDRASWRNAVAAARWEASDENGGTVLRATVGRGAVRLPVLALPEGHLNTVADRVTTAAYRLRARASSSELYGAEMSFLGVTENVAGASTDSTARCSARPCWTAQSLVVGLFAEWRRPAMGRAHTSFGLRVNGDLLDASIQLLPRASLTFDVAKNAALGVSAGRYSQVVTLLPDSNRAAALVASVAGAPELRRLHATQIDLGTFLRRGASTIAASLGARWYEARPQRPAAMAATVGVSSTWSSSRAALVASYEAVFYSRQATSGAADPNRRDQQAMVGSIRLPVGRLRTDLSATYAVGVPFTSVVLERPTTVPLSDAPTNALLAEDSRLRLDVQLGAEWRLGSGARAVSLEPYVAVLNVLNRRDALFYYRGSSTSSRAQPLATLPRFVTVGLRWSARSPTDRRR